MGDTFDDSDFDNYRQEKPAHEVCVDDFWMGKFEVTQAEFQKVMGTNPSYFKKDGTDCPVERVSWNDARKFAKKLSLMTGKSYRLPTEAEWEYAAREGGKKVRFGTGRDIVSASTANFDARALDMEKYSVGGEFRDKTVRVGSFVPNSLGLYDMSGNVYEWVQDYYDEWYYNKGPQKGPWKNPQAVITGKDCNDCRVLRGGSWRNAPIYLRASFRDGLNPASKINDIGFRLVVSP